MTTENREALLRYAIVEYQGAIDHAHAIFLANAPGPVMGTLGRLRREQRLVIWHLLNESGRPATHVPAEVVTEVVDECRAWLTKHPEHIERIERKEMTPA